jgi:hypothetical protein
MMEAVTVSEMEIHSILRPLTAQKDSSVLFKLQKRDLNANCVYWWPEMFGLDVDIYTATKHTFRDHASPFSFTVEKQHMVS